MMRRQIEFESWKCMYDISSQVVSLLVCLIPLALTTGMLGLFNIPLLCSHYPTEEDV